VQPTKQTGQATRGPALSAADSYYYRTIWISDLHLGTRACKAQALLDFLQSHHAETLYLVGDIVDGWNIGSSWYWSPAQKGVVEEIAAWHRRGVRVVFLPGNHDLSSADLIEILFGLVPTTAELVHRTAEGRRMLVIHGHQFDTSHSAFRWWSMMGSQAYTFVLRINEWYKRERLRVGDGSVSAYLRRPMTSAIGRLASTHFDDHVVFDYVRRRNADGVICGHIHRAEQRLIGPLWYINDGDWVENCTALVEDHYGTLRLVQWRSAPERSFETGAYVEETR
jgi:UDP-2,3-diacylglucosamine pyrophosphatase LpxH